MRASSDRGVRARAEIIRTADGREVLVAAITEGRGGPAAGEAAELVLEHVFRTIPQHRGPDLNEAFQVAGGSAAHGLETRREHWGAGLAVEIAVMAAHQGRVFYASAGTASLYLVSQNECRRLVAEGSAPLTTVGRASIITGPKEGILFRPEDQVILASSGLTAVSPEDHRPYVRPADIPGYVSGNPPMEAARHLISIALGRDVAEDICVIVMKAPGRRRRRPVILAIGLAISVIAFAIAVAALAVDRLSPTITAQPDADYGYAVLVDGDILMQTTDPSRPGPIGIQPLETIPAGSRILAQADSRLRLQTTYEGPSDSSTLTIYLAAGSIVRLTWLDPHRAASGSDPEPYAERSLVTLDSGAILLRRSGGSRWSQIRSGDTVAAFSPPGPAALAVASNPDSTEVDCIHGGCVLQIAQQSPVFVEAPGRVEVRNGAAGPMGPLQADALSSWNHLCGGCFETSP